jgi:hypothetical protein
MTRTCVLLRCVAFKDIRTKLAPIPQPVIKAPRWDNRLLSSMSAPRLDGLRLISSTTRSEG